MRLQAIHHARFMARDLDALQGFASDFGLVSVERSDERLVMRTRGGDTCAYVAEKGDADAFVGLGFEVEDRTSLEEVVHKLGASPFAPLDVPGGGECVSLTDPDGNIVWLVDGNARGEAEPPDDELVINTPFRKERFGRQQDANAIAAVEQRLEEAAAVQRELLVKSDGPPVKVRKVIQRMLNEQQK